MRSILKSLVTMIAGALMLGSAWAAEPLLIDVDSEHMPFMFSQGDKAAGVYPAVMSAIFAKLGIPVTILAKPWKRAIAELDESYAGVGGIYLNEERSKKYDYSEAMFSENIAVFFNKDKPISFKSLADLNGKKIGVRRGWSYGDAFDAAKKEGRFAVEEVDSDKANAMKLANGRVDAVLMVEEGGKAAISAEQLTNIEESKVYLASTKAYLAFNKTAKQTELLANFNKTLLSMKHDGSFDAIVLKELAK